MLTMVLVSADGRTSHIIKETGKMVSTTVKVNINGRMVRSTLELGTKV